MGDVRQPPGAGGPTNPGWYVDPWGQSAWRWWDGGQWTGWLSPPQVTSPYPTPFLTEAAERPKAAGRPPPVPRSQRRRLLAELLVVLAVFPLPYAVSAIVALVADLLGNGPGQRTPVLIKGHAAASFPFELVLILLPFAAAGLVAYLLSGPGGFGTDRVRSEAGSQQKARSGEGGLSAIGLDRSSWRGDLALVIAVFVFCELIPIYGGGFALRAAGVHGIAPHLGGSPGYFVVLDLFNGITSGIVEEIVVLGFLIRRLEQLNLPAWAVVVIAVAVRGSYHLYYGWAVLPILVWATVTVLLYRRYRRLLPFIIVHVIWDSSLFIAGAMALRSAGIFLMAEAAILVPVSFVLFLSWRRQIPAPTPDAARR
ncbi:MAG: DUF2510 domain-containing protein [Acidimicrobiales bacterium]